MDEKTNSDEGGSEAVVRPEEKEAQPSVISITAPAPFDDESLEPLVEAYMEKRGLSDKKQAAIKLAQTMFRLGINPQREIQNVNAYVESMSAMLDHIPDYPESEGIKGTIAGRTALEAGQRIRATHFPDLDEEQEMKNLFRTAQRYKLMGKALEGAFGGGEETDNSRVKYLESRIDSLEKKKELDEQLQPIRADIKTLTDTVNKLIEEGGVKGRGTDELTSISDKIDGIGKRIDNLEARDKFTSEVSTIKSAVENVVNEVKTLKAGGAGGDLERLESVLTTTVNVLDKVQNITSREGGEGLLALRKGEQGLDWRTVAISQGTEVVKEGIRAAKDIAIGKTKEESPTKKQEISEKVIDQVVMGYCMKEIAKGNFDINVEKAAAELELPPKQVAESVMRLKERKVFKTKSEEQGQEGAKPERTEGEGTIKGARRSEAVIVP